MRRDCYQVNYKTTGDYKICATSNSPYGVTRIILEIFAFHPDELNQAIQQQKDKIEVDTGIQVPPKFLI